MNRAMRTLALVGILAGSLAGVTATVDSAQALPIASSPVHASDAATTAVRYYPYGYRRFYGHRYGYRRGRAGLYKCGVYQFHTHLQRKACR